MAQNKWNAMRILLQYNIGDLTIELGIYSGVVFGFRTFEPNEMYDQSEIHLYIPFIYLGVIKKMEDN
jgi:hypothetical protein